LTFALSHVHNHSLTDCWWCVFWRLLFLEGSRRLGGGWGAGVGGGLSLCCMWLVLEVGGDEGVGVMKQTMWLL